MKSPTASLLGVGAAMTMALMTPIVAGAAAPVHMHEMDLALAQQNFLAGNAARLARLAHAHQAYQDVAWERAAIFAVIAFLIGALLAGGIVFTTMGRKSLDTLEQKVDEQEQTLIAPPKEGSVVSSNDEDAFDYEEMLRLLALRSAQMYGPKLAKAQAVKKICEERAFGFVGKAKGLILNEIGSTAGSLLKEVGNEEAMLLLDFDGAIGSYFPPLSVLLAGLMSPTVLLLSYWNHVIQVLVVHIPIMTLCLWAAWQDWHAECQGIPTLTIWVYAQFIVASLLAVGHVVVAIEVKKGQATVRSKTEEMRKKLGAKVSNVADEMALTDVRELFICSSVLLQQALLAEEKVRRSFFNTLIGVLTILSCLMTFWTFVVCLGWATIPGQVAMHEDAKAVVPPGEFCGAWASIIAIRIVMMLSVIFLIFNVASVGQWIAEHLVHNSSYSSGVVSKAKDIDDSYLGLPVAQTIVKSFLLRGSTDMLSSQLSVTGSNVKHLEEERLEMQAKLAALDTQIQDCEKEMLGFDGQCTLTAKDKKRMADMEASFEELKGAETSENEEVASAREGVQDRALAAQGDLADMHGMAMDEAKVKAAKLEAYTKQELDKMFLKLQDLIHQVQDSDMVHAAMEKAKAIEEETARRALEVKEGVQNIDVAAAVDSAREQGKAVVETAKKKAEEVQKSEALQAAMAKGQEAVQIARAKGGEAASAAQQSEAGQAAMAKGQEAVAAADAALKSESVQKGMEQAAQVATEVKDTAVKAAAKAKGAAKEALKGGEASSSKSDKSEGSKK